MAEKHCQLIFSSQSQPKEWNFKIFQVRSFLQLYYAISIISSSLTHIRSPGYQVGIISSLIYRSFSYLIGFQLKSRLRFSILPAFQSRARKWQQTTLHLCYPEPAEFCNHPSPSIQLGSGGGSEIGGPIYFGDNTTVPAVPLVASSQNEKKCYLFLVQIVLDLAPFL